MSSEPEVIACNCGYPCRYFPTILDGPVFRWGDRFEVSSSRNGVMISGYSPPMSDSIEPFKDLLDLAFVVHRLLAQDDRDTQGARQIIAEHARRNK